MRVLLLTPPMSQLNTPYPATPYLTGFLDKHAARLGLEVAQEDLALSLFLALFTRTWFSHAADLLRARHAATPRKRRDQVPPSVDHFLLHAERYIDTVEPVIRFLQGRDPSLALRIVGRELLPEGPRWDPVREHDRDEEGLRWAFGAMGTQDQARYLASLYIDDLADTIKDGLDDRFELARYGEGLAASAASFDTMQAALTRTPSPVDEALDELVTDLVARQAPDVICLTVPFPGNVYGALRIARKVRELAPATRLLLGGGFVNTELRALAEPRLFDYVDYITLDDGERPLLCILEALAAPDDPDRTLLRTFVRQDGQVVFRTDLRHHDLPQRETGTPTYRGLPLPLYPSLVEMLNPMHRLWSDGRWNKLTVAHGCYWKKCSFCDIHLDYIGRYDASPASLIVDRMEALVAETGQSGFHFVDEAAPPAGLRAVATEILRRRLTVTWWGNIRFEKAFAPELCALLARSGCVAVSGGLEVASDRLLELMEKGVTVEQVARVTHAFTEAGIMVHAYLMYGFPTETEQETVDSLERVRQLFAAGCIQSGFWHRFAATLHSPIGQEPARFGITIDPLPPAPFAANDLPFVDPTGCDHDALSEGLRRAIYNYMLGIGLDDDVRRWFLPERKVPRPKVDADLVEKALE